MIKLQITNYKLQIALFPPTKLLIIFDIYNSQAKFLFETLHKRFLSNAASRCY